MSNETKNLCALGQMPIMVFLEELALSYFSLLLHSKVRLYALGLYPFFYILFFFFPFRVLFAFIVFCYCFFHGLSNFRSEFLGLGSLQHPPPPFSLNIIV